MKPRPSYLNGMPGAPEPIIEDMDKSVQGGIRDSGTASRWNWQDHASHDHIQSIVFDVNMDMKDQVALNSILKENSD